MSDPQRDAFLQKFGEKPATVARLLQVFDTLVEAIQSHKSYGEKLSARIQALEAKPTLKFCGVFEGGKSYEPGDAVVHQSALWVCKVATSGTPSKDFVGWQLAIKKGDAR